jgi:hypothetical protein
MGALRVKGVKKIVQNRSSSWRSRSGTRRVHYGLCGRDDKWGLGSATEGEEKSTNSGGEGNWAVGHFWNQAKVLPVALFPFSNSFLFSFFCFYLKTFANKTLFDSNQF